VIDTLQRFREAGARPAVNRSDRVARSTDQATNPRLGAESTQMRNQIGVDSGLSAFISMTTKADISETRLIDF